MQTTLVAEEEAQQRRIEKRERLAKSWTLRWAHNTKRLLMPPLMIPVRPAKMVWEELSENLEKRSRARAAEKLRRYNPLKLRSGKRSAQTKSSLLSLPAEIRVMVWKYVVAGKLIMLYRRGGYITSSSLDRHGTMSVTNATSHIVRDLKTGSNTTCASMTPKAKTGFMALLQTCQTTYLETIAILYQDNTFVCLDSTVLVDLRSGRSRFNMSLIRSLQYSIGTNKFSSFETTPSELEMIPSPCDIDTSESVSKIFHQRFPNLQYLSIFLHGRLYHDKRYASMMEHLHSIYEQRISITMNALELPEAYFVRNASLPFGVPTPFVRIRVGSKRPVYIISGQGLHEIVDPQVENDTWRVGGLWLQPYEAEGPAKTLVYAVLITEDEKESAIRKHEPALLWDIIPAPQFRISNSSFA